jgi:glutamate racemase
MSRPALIQRLQILIAFLQSEEVTHLVIGCNAASTVLPFLDHGRLKIEGVIDSAVKLTLRLRPANLGLIGGRRTVLSGVYRQAFADRGLTVRQRIAQPLSGRIENGDTSSAQLHDDCRAILTPLKKCSHILLACTHYPAISSVLKQYVSAETSLIDPGTELVSQVSKWRLPKGGRDRFLTSGEPQKMVIAASNAFDVRLRSVEKIAI